MGVIVRGEIHAVHSDHLNTPRLMTDAQNQPAWQWAYSAFGDNEPSVAARNFRDRSWAFANGELRDLADGSDDADNGPQFGRKMVKLNLRYPGQYFDDESNLHYNYRRIYDARTGRYTQPDPIGLGAGWNRFAYVEGNPLSYTDPLGLWSVEGGVYLGVGASMTLGRDPTSGGRFMTFKFGKGFGWGASYDPLGGRAGSAEDQSCKGGIGLGFYAEGGGHAGPLTGKVEANLGRNFFFGGGSDGYGGIQPKGTLDSNLRGTKAVGAAGVEITIFGPRVSK